MSEGELTPIAHDRFGGLNLIGQPDNLRPGESIDQLDVVLFERGKVATRDALRQYADLASYDVPYSLFPAYFTNGDVRLVVGESAGCSVWNAAGTNVTSAAYGTNLTGMARYGEPNSERLYLANGTDTLIKFTGGVLSQPTVTTINPTTLAETAAQTAPKPGSLAVWERENRLVLGAFGTTTGGPAAAATSPDHVWFAEPGRPEAYRTDSFLRLSPGDGEKIQAVVAWRDLIFIFKQSKFFVVTHTSVDGNGVPIFNYRTVDTGVGAVGPFAVAAGREGVFIVGRDGLYITTGDAPVRLSDLVEPLWTNRSAPFFTGGYIDQADIAGTRLAWINERLYISYSSTLAASSNRDRLLVFDPAEGWFGLWSTNIGASLATAICGLRRTDKNELVVAFADKKLGVMGSSGTVLESLQPFWVGAPHDFGDPKVKRMRQSVLWGAGSVEYGVRCDYASPEWRDTVTFGTSVDTWGDENWNAGTWGGALPLNAKHCRKGARASKFAIELRTPAANGTWSVSQVVQHVAGIAHVTKASEPV